MVAKKSALRKKLEEGWEDLADFVRTSGVPVSGETARAAIDLPDRPVSASHFIFVCKYLGFTAEEIAKLVVQRCPGVKAEALADLIGGSGIYLTPQETNLLVLYRKLKRKNKLRAQLELLAEAEGIKLPDCTGDKIVKIGRGR